MNQSIIKDTINNLSELIYSTLVKLNAEQTDFGIARLENQFKILTRLRKELEITCSNAII